MQRLNGLQRDPYDRILWHDNTTATIDKLHSLTNNPAGERTGHFHSHNQRWRFPVFDQLEFWRWRIWNRIIDCSHLY